MDAYNGVNKDDERDVRRFRALHLSEWSDAGSMSFISREEWMDLAMEFETEEEEVQVKKIARKEKRGQQKQMLKYIKEIKDDVVCTLGIDLSHVNDFTGLSILVRDKNNAMWLSTTFLITCKKKVEDSEIEPNAYRLRKHVKRGDCLVFGEKLIDHTAVANFICNTLIREYELPIRHITYDRYGSIHLVDTLKKRLPQLQEYIQAAPNNAWISFGEANRILKEGSFRHDGNPMMTWQIGNVHIKMDRNANPIINKEYNRNKIDGVVAMIYAFNSTIALQMGLIQEGEDKIRAYQTGKTIEEV